MEDTDQLPSPRDVLRRKGQEKTKQVAFRVREDEYRKLLDDAKRLGCRSFSDFVRYRLGLPKVRGQ